MKYLKNIHEHKNNISVVSKKIILGMVFVFGIIAISNAKTSIINLKLKELNCNEAFTTCDLWAGDSYECFLECMNDYGC